MALKARSMALIITLTILIILFSSAVNGQDTRGMAIVANKEKALGITIGPVTVAPGHVAFAYQNPLTGLFVFGSVGMDLSKPTNLIDPNDLDINTEYTFDELKTLLAKKSYTSYKVFYADNPNFGAATKAEIDLTTANYNLFASTTKPITDPFSHAVGADDENCLTGTKKVLEAYGVDLPDWDKSFLDTISVASLPNVWYLSLQGNMYYPDFMGDDPIVPKGYRKSTSSIIGEWTYTVPATADWIDTGIQVSKGDTIKFTATDQASYGHEGSPDSYPTTNPDGNRYVNNDYIGEKIDLNAIDPSAPIGSLVGKIGTNNECFFIGSRNQLTMPASGTIMLRYNDVEGGYYNNGGSYKVIISKDRLSLDSNIMQNLNIIGTWKYNWYDWKTWTHEMVIDSFNQETGDFNGHGWYPDDPSYKWDLSGTVNGKNIKFLIEYIGANPGYTVNNEGIISSATYMSGKGVASNGAGTWDAIKITG
jgi:hypothetical protein